jgi:hypothetical protein
VPLVVVVVVYVTLEDVFVMKVILGLTVQPYFAKMIAVEMVFVQMELAFAKEVGKEMIVVNQIAQKIAIQTEHA